MHKLIEYICDELEELERKADKGGKLTMSEIQYGDVLAHFKKNLLTGEAMMEGEEEEYSNASGNSYARGRGRNARRDSMGRYSREGGQGGQGNQGGSYRGGQGGQGGGSYEGSYRGGSGGSYRGGSYEGYSREGAKEDLVMQLREMEQEADEESRRMIKKWIKQVEEQ